jgi:hypothetical protein
MANIVKSHFPHMRRGVSRDMVGIFGTRIIKDRCQILQ